MTVFGFHASHEQVHPSELLAAVQEAESAGFTAAMCSDHFAPWLPEQGHSAFAWSWLGAALQATRLPFGVVTAPGQRYHPAVLAQAIGTLGAMFPGRFWAALGSGEHLNEHITGDEWPTKDARNERLRESATAMRALLAGETVSADEGGIRMHEAKLWTKPGVVPPLLAAAVSAETAGWAAAWAEGLITVGHDPGTARQVIEAYRDAGGEGTIALQVHVSYASTDQAARELANRQWRSGAVSPPRSWNLPLPEDFAEETSKVTPDDADAFVMCSASTARHADHLAALAETGADEVYVHHVGVDQADFIAAYGEHVLPALQPTTEGDA
jgi:probable non-F420 flavinoid oxidoreductase